MSKQITGILFGSTAAGKTSLIRMLEDPTHVVETLSVYSTTEHPTFHIIPIDWKSQSTSYQLKVIDTPSLREIRCSNDARTNENIIEEICQFLNDQKITHLSFVGLVFNVDRISNDEITAFKELRLFLGEAIASRTFLIFTHCEAKKIPADLKRIDEKYCSSEMYRALVEYAQLGRIYTGVLHLDLFAVEDVSSHNQTLLKQGILANVLKMRHKFLEKVFNNYASVPIPEHWFGRPSTSSNLHTINANQPPSHIASNCSEQYGAASSMRDSSQTPQRKNGCCSKIFKWCTCQRCFDYYLLTAFFLFCTLTLYLFKYLWIFVAWGVGYLWIRFRGLFFDKPRAQPRNKTHDYRYCFSNKNGSVAAESPNAND